MKEEFLTFLMAQRIEVNDPNTLIRLFLRRFYGTRNLRLYLLTVAKKNDVRSRPKMQDRDQRGFEICKCKKILKLLYFTYNNFSFLDICNKILLEIQLSKNGWN